MEHRWLVELVHEPHRNEQEAGAEAELRPPLIVDVGELDRHLAALPGRAVLELDLRVEEPAVVPAIAEVEHGPEPVELVGPSGEDIAVGLRIGVLVEHLAVAADRDPLLGAVDLGGRRAESVVALVRRRRRLAQPLALELGREDIDAPGELGEGIGERFRRQVLRGQPAIQCRQAPNPIAAAASRILLVKPHTRAADRRRVPA